jgi:hypothetical protein
MSSTPTTPLAHPAYLRVAERRASQVQLRLADAITRFAGSMTFGFTLVVSLELKTNTEITRAIHALTTELHRRLVP